MTTVTRTNPLSYLTDQLNDLKQRGTCFRLRVLEDGRAPICTFDGKKPPPSFQTVHYWTLPRARGQASFDQTAEQPPMLLMARKLANNAHGQGIADDKRIACD